MTRLTALALWAALLCAQPEAITKKTASMEKFAGYFSLYWDAKGGKLWLEIDKFETEFLYQTWLATGIGSNDIGLDRGRPGSTHLVRFERSGPRVLLLERNYGFRATSANPSERQAVEEAFAQSVLWGAQVDSEENGRVLVDATTLFLRDAAEVTSTLQRTRQGTFRLDANRSAFYLPRTKNFPKNTEVEVTLTFSSDQPGPLLRGVTPTPEAVTVRQHHSLVELPGPGYQPRTHDPRAGYFGISYMDFAAPIGDQIRKRFIARHRLDRSSPIVYYLDPGTPEPIRTALLEGARWWDQAFEAAGFRNAFRVEMLPADADPMDVRYNVIQWVHRSTRGWSYGASIIDPRTGEIIKGKVTLGSLRVRQDYLIAEGLLAPYEEGNPANPEMEKMALARLRQLSAHEVGHTLGLQHNYVSSAHGRASVMDYPHPLARLNGKGAPDLSGAYAEGIGEWDKVAIAYGYGESDVARRKQILEEAHKRGLYYLGDSDARPESSAHPLNHLWDNGSNAVDELKRVMAIRTRALERFSENAVRPGAPLATLEEVLVPVYLMHRYQMEAAAKVVGGLDYRYNLRGDGQKLPEIVPGAEQRRAIAALLETLSPGFLTLPERILERIPPRPPGYARHRETFPARTGLTFDPVAAAESAAGLTLNLMLNPERASRLIQYSARNKQWPGLEEVLDRVIGATWRATRFPGLEGEVQRAVDHAALRALFALATSESASPSARALAMSRVDSLSRWMEQAPQSPHVRYGVDLIRRFKDNPKEVTLGRTAEAPPGMPIGDEDCTAPPLLW